MLYVICLSYLLLLHHHHYTVNSIPYQMMLCMCTVYVRVITLTDVLTYLLIYVHTAYFPMLIVCMIVIYFIMKSSFHLLYISGFNSHVHCTVFVIKYSDSRKQELELGLLLDPCYILAPTLGLYNHDQQRTPPKQRTPPIQYLAGSVSSSHEEFEVRSRTLVI